MPTPLLRNILCRLTVDQLLIAEWLLSGSHQENINLMWCRKHRSFLFRPDLNFAPFGEQSVAAEFPTSTETSTAAKHQRRQLIEQRINQSLSRHLPCTKSFYSFFQSYSTQLKSLTLPFHQCFDLTLMKLLLSAPCLESLHLIGGGDISNWMVDKVEAEEWRKWMKQNVLTVDLVFLNCTLNQMILDTLFCLSPPRRPPQTPTPPLELSLVQSTLPHLPKIVRMGGSLDLKVHNSRSVASGGGDRKTLPPLVLRKHPQFLTITSSSSSASSPALTKSFSTSAQCKRVNLASSRDSSMDTANSPVFKRILTLSLQDFDINTNIPLLEMAVTAGISCVTMKNCALPSTFSPFVQSSTTPSPSAIRRFHFVDTDFLLTPIHSTFTATLTHLSLIHSNAQDFSLATPLTSFIRRSTSLKSLDISRSKVSTVALLTLIESVTESKSLLHVAMDNVDMSSSAARFFIGRWKSCLVLSLSIAGNALSRSLCRDFIYLPLTHLNLNRNQVDDSIFMLPLHLHSNRSLHLTHLDLSNADCSSSMKLSDAAVDSLYKHHSPKLQWLRLRHHQCGTETATALLKQILAGPLEYVDLHGNWIEDDFLEIIKAQQPLFPSIVARNAVLILSDNRFSSTVKATLDGWLLGGEKMHFHL